MGELDGELRQKGEIELAALALGHVVGHDEGADLHAVIHDRGRVQERPAFLAVLGQHAVLDLGLEHLSGQRLTDAPFEEGPVRPGEQIEWVHGEQLVARTLGEFAHANR